MAARDGRGPRDARGARRGGGAVHAPGARPGRRACASPGATGGPGPRALDPRRAYRCERGAGPGARALLLRRRDLPRDRLRRAAPLGRRDGDAPPGRLRRGRRTPSSSTSRPTARPTATTTASARWRWRPPAPGSRRAAPRRLTNHARLPRGSPADARGAGRRRLVVELRPRRRALARRLRVPGGAPPGWTQRWRAPLREALDWLRDAVDPLYEARAGALLKDPWAARDAYVEVVLDRSPASVEAFLERHAVRPLDAADRVQALRCLELQRHRLLMYTSCGWFFDEISGIETVQVLRYAARVLQLARRSAATPGWRRSSSGAWRRPRRTSPSSGTAPGCGAATWRPSVTDLARVAAHYAIAGPSEGYGDPADVHAFRSRAARVGPRGRGRGVARDRPRARDGAADDRERGSRRGRAARARRRGPLPRADGTDPDALAPARDALFREFPGRGPAEWPHALERRFGGRVVRRRDVFPDERRRLLAGSPSVPGRPRRAPATARGRQPARSSRSCGAAEGPVPPALAGVGAPLWRGRAARSWPRSPAGGPVRPRGRPDPRARSPRPGRWGSRSSSRPEQVGPAIQAALGRVLAGASGRARRRRPSTMRSRSWRSGPTLETPPDLWAAQNAAARLWREGSTRDREALAPLMAALGFARARSARPRGAEVGDDRPPLERPDRSPRPGGARDRRRPRDRPGVAPWRWPGPAPTSPSRISCPRATPRRAIAATGRRAMGLPLDVTDAEAVRARGRARRGGAGTPRRPRDRGGDHPPGPARGDHARPCGAASSTSC